MYNDINQKRCIYLEKAQTFFQNPELFRLILYLCIKKGVDYVLCKHQIVSALQ